MTEFADGGTVRLAEQESGSAKSRSAQERVSLSANQRARSLGAPREPPLWPNIQKPGSDYDTPISISQAHNNSRSIPISPPPQLITSSSEDV